MTGSSVIFSPDWQVHLDAAEGKYLPPEFSNLAYAIYRFELADYTGPPELQQDWVIEPNWNELWFGLSNFETNRWDWVPAGELLLALETLAPYTNTAGTMLVVPMLSGITPSELAWLRFGGNIEPDASLVATPEMGAAPLPIACDASDCFDLDDGITELKWDFDSDGTWDLTSGPDERLQGWTFTELGEHEITIQVTDVSGASKLATDTVLVSSIAEPQWHFIEISINSEPFPFQPSLAEIDGNPAISYTFDSSGNTGLYYARALGPYGAHWREPALIVNGVNSSNLNELNELPAISATAQENLDALGVKFVSGDTADGHNWINHDSWVAQNAGGNQRWAVVEDKPALGYWKDKKIWFNPASDEQGSAWEDPIPVYTSHHVAIGFAHVLIADGNPAIITGSSHWADIGYSRALDATGTAWGPRTEIAVGYNPSGLLIAGHPALIYHRHLGPDDSTLVYLRADDASGSTWPSGIELVPSEYQAGKYHTTIAPNNLPMVFYHQPIGLPGFLPGLYRSQAEDAVGSSWTSPEALDTGAVVGNHCSAAVIGGNPAVAYNAQYLASNPTQRLIFAIYY